MSQLSGKKLTTPKHVIIERTALEFAAVFYEAGRSQGATSKYKNAREFAKANLETFIPKAIEILTDMLSKSHISDAIKSEIAEALIERANDPDLAFLGKNKTAELPADIAKHIRHSFGIGDYGYGKKVN